MFVLAGKPSVHGCTINHVPITIQSHATKWTRDKRGTETTQAKLHWLKKSLTTKISACHRKQNGVEIMLLDDSALVL